MTSRGRDIVGGMSSFAGFTISSPAAVRLWDSLILYIEGFLVVPPVPTA
jgi:hypothetical protein